MLEYLGIIFLSFAGFSLATYLHHKKKKPEPMVCPMHGHCKAVIKSKYSRFLGVPVEIMGMLYYGAMALGYGALSILPLLVPTYFGYILFAMSFAGFLFSVYLTFVQIFSLKQICTWCLTSAGISTLIFVVALIGSYSQLKGFLGGQKDIITILHVFSMAIGLGAATLTDLLFFKFLKDLRISEKESEVLELFSQVIWAALAMVVISGLGLFIPESERLLMSSKFIVKVMVVSVIIINGVVLNLLISPKLIKITFGKDHKHKEGELHRTRKLAFAAGPISIVSWYTAFILGSLRGLPFSVWQLLIVYGAALAIGSFVGQFLEQHFTIKGFTLKNSSD